MKPHTILKPGIYPGIFAEFEYRPPADCKPIHKHGRFRLSFLATTPGGEEVEVRKYCNAAINPKSALTAILTGLSGMEYAELYQHAEQQGLNPFLESLTGTRCNLCIAPKTTNAGDRFNNVEMVVKI